MNQLTFLFLIIVVHFEREITNVYLNVFLQLKPVFASCSVRYGWGLGHGSGGSCCSKSFSVLFTFSVQLVHSNLKSFCVSLPFPSAASTAVTVP